MVGKLDVEGTDIEVVAYRRGNDVSLTLNKSGVCVFRMIVQDVVGEVANGALMSLNMAGPDLVVPVWGKVAELQALIDGQMKLRKD